MGKVRIISGKWRGRKIIFPDNLSIRPTGDRMRETLFNWLTPVIVDAHCLDLFAGSGILSVEALSRGAASVTLIDQNYKVISYLKTVFKPLSATNIELIQSDAIKALSKLQKTFDIVFLDPPFNKNLLPQCIELLDSLKLLNHNAVIYVESEQELNTLKFPSNWQLLHDKTAGQVRYRLLQVTL